MDDLTYRWEATSGTITGTGRIVKWKAPIGNATPAAYKVSLTGDRQLRGRRAESGAPRDG